MAYNTGNAIGSADVRDLYDNAHNLDKAMNSTDPTWIDRFGVARPTFKGAESELNQKVGDAEAAAAQALGYLNTMRATSYGPLAEDPTTDPLGNPCTAGDEYFNTTYNLLKRFDGSIWRVPDINTENLASGAGSSMVGHGGQTVEAALNERLPEIGTYAQLRAYTGPVTAFFVRGVANIFDGGAGVFRVDASDTTAADNGGTVLVDASGRRWKRNFSGAVNLAWFGAVGDWSGTSGTDDTVPLRKAVDFCLKTESDMTSPAGKTYRITGEIDFPKYHSGVVRRWITFDFNGSAIYLDGNITGFGYTKVLTGPLDVSNYFLIFANINFKAAENSGAIAIRPAGFVSSKFINLQFWGVDYPFYQQNSDPRGTPNYVQSAHIDGCYSIQHKRFFTANQVYDFRMYKNIVDAGVDGVCIDRGASGQSGYICDIAGNAFQSHSGVAVLLGGMQALTLGKNYFENNAKEVLLTGTITQRDGSNGVYWEYIAAVSAWASGASIADSGTYKTNAGNLYVSSTIGTTGATAPTHTSGTVSDGGVSWTFVGSYTAWASGEAINNFGEFRSNASKIYRSATTGTTGSTAPTHVNGTVFNYGGSVENNFNQPKGTPVTGYRAFIELAETPTSGFKLGGNVDQAQRLYYFSRFSQGYFNTLGDRTAVKTSDLYNVATRPDNVRAIFADDYRFGVLWGKDGGMVFNPISRGIEYTHAEYDYLDSITSARVPIVQGVANIAAPGSGAGVEGKAWPPSAFPTIYPQKPWARGSYLSNPTPEVLGTAGSQYVIVGWICTVSGTPGTWVACRVLTGT